MAQQTAIQELINEIVKHLTYDDDLSDDSRIAYETIRLRCLSKLSMEKQQIKFAYNDGADAVIANKYTAMEDYYNKMYNHE